MHISSCFILNNKAIMMIARRILISGRPVSQIYFKVLSFLKTSKMSLCQNVRVKVECRLSNITSSVQNRAANMFLREKVFFN